MSDVNSSESSDPASETFHEADGAVSMEEDYGKRLESTIPTFIKDLTDHECIDIVAEALENIVMCSLDEEFRNNCLQTLNLNEVSSLKEEVSTRLKEIVEAQEHRCSHFRCASKRPMNDSHSQPSVPKVIRIETVTTQGTSVADASNIYSYSEPVHIPLLDRGPLWRDKHSMGEDDDFHPGVANPQENSDDILLTLPSSKFGPKVSTTSQKIVNDVPKDTPPKKSDIAIKSSTPENNSILVTASPDVTDDVIGTENVETDNCKIADVLPPSVITPISKSRLDFPDAKPISSQVNFSKTPKSSAIKGKNEDIQEKDNTINEYDESGPIKQPSLESNSTFGTHPLLHKEAAHIKPAITDYLQQAIDNLAPSSLNLVDDDGFLENSTTTLIRSSQTQRSMSKNSLYGTADKEIAYVQPKSQSLYDDNNDIPYLTIPEINSTDSGSETLSPPSDINETGESQNLSDEIQISYKDTQNDEHSSSSCQMPMSASISSDEMNPYTAENRDNKENIVNFAETEDRAKSNLVGDLTSYLSQLWP